MTDPTSADPTVTNPRTGVRRPRSLTVLVVANAVSLTGNVIATVAIPWLVLTTTRSAAQAGVALFASAAAAAIGGLLAGRVVDAVGPTRASATADLLSALAVLPLPILLAFDALQLPHIVLLAFAGALADSTGSAARQSLVPAAADARGLARERANALFTSAEHVGYLVGAPLAGLLISLIGVAGTLWFTVAAFAVAATLVAIGVKTAPPSAASTDTHRVGTVEAARFIWADPALRALVVFPTIATLLIAPLVPIVLPVLAREAHGDPVSLGLMVAAFGIGGLVGTTLFGTLGASLPRRSVFVGVNLAWPVIYATLATVPPLVVALVAVLALGMIAGALVPMMATVRQERSPAHLLARVTSLSMAAVPVVGPIAVLVSGLLIDGLGIGPTLWVMTGGTALLAAGTLASRGIRALDATSARTSRPPRTRGAVPAGAG